MIVCSCSRITDRDILEAIDWMRLSDAYTLITPGKVYRALGKRPNCGGCISLFIDCMHQNDSLQVPAELRNLRQADASEDRDEGRRGRNRLSQPGAAE